MSAHRSTYDMSKASATKWNVHKGSSRPLRVWCSRSVFDRRSRREAIRLRFGDCFTKPVASVARQSLRGTEKEGGGRDKKRGQGKRKIFYLPPCPPQMLQRGKPDGRCLNGGNLRTALAPQRTGSPCPLIS